MDNKLRRNHVRPEVAPDATRGEDNSAPNRDARIDPLPALGTYRDGHRDLSLLTEGTDIGQTENSFPACYFGLGRLLGIDQTIMIAVEALEVRTRAEELTA